MEKRISLSALFVMFGILLAGAVFSIPNVSAGGSLYKLAVLNNIIKSSGEYDVLWQGRYGGGDLLVNLRSGSGISGLNLNSENLGYVEYSRNNVNNYDRSRYGNNYDRYGGYGNSIYGNNYGNYGGYYGAGYGGGLGGYYGMGHGGYYGTGYSGSRYGGGYNSGNYFRDNSERLIIDNRDLNKNRAEVAIAAINSNVGIHSIDGEVRRSEIDANVAIRAIDSYTYTGFAGTDRSLWSW